MTKILLFVTLVAGMATGVASITVKPAAGLRFRAHLQGGCGLERKNWDAWFNADSPKLLARMQDTYVREIELNRDVPKLKKLLKCCSSKQGVGGLYGAVGWGESGTGTDVADGCKAPTANRPPSKHGGYLFPKDIIREGKEISFKDFLTEQCEATLWFSAPPDPNVQRAIIKLRAEELRISKAEAEALIKHEQKEHKAQNVWGFCPCEGSTSATDQVACTVKTCRGCGPDFKPKISPRGYAHPGHDI